MARYAPIGPPALLMELAIHGDIGDYHLFLAQEVLKHPQDYHEIYMNLPSDSFIIMDNGACEGKAVKPSHLVEAAAVMRANAICLPDELQNKSKTLRLIKQFLDQTHLSMQVQGFTVDNLMAIPQGESLVEVIDCAQEVVKILGRVPRYWGVPRWIGNHYGTRERIVEALQHEELRPETNGEPYIHLLGMTYNLKDDLICAQLSNVMGIDSANPLVLGQQWIDMFINFQHADRVIRDKVDGSIVWNFWDETSIAPQTLGNIRRLRAAIA